MPRFESIIENDFFNPDASHTHDGVNSKKIKYSDLEGIPSLDFIPNSAKGTQDGVAPLDTNKKVPKENLPADTVYDINYTHTDNNFTNALKTKLDNIEANSQVNDIETISAGNTTLPITNKNVNIPIATKTQLGLIKVGRNLSITTDGVLSASGGTSGGVGGDTLPIGSTVEWWSEEIPENWLVCNGQAVSRTEYADLFSVLGVTYGEGDGSTTFNLPNIQGRTLIGKSSEEDYSVLGKTGGEKQHSLTVQEMASHSHSGLTGIAKTSFMRAVEVPGGNVVSNHTVSNGSGAYKDVGSGSSDFPGANHYHDFVTNEVGEGKAFSIVQPYITTFYIIKAKQSVPITSTVEDVLNSTSTTNALSANQGRILNNKVVANDDLISTLQEDVIGIEDNMITNVKLNNATLPKTNKEVNIPIASRTQLGVFKVGENLTISEEGILSATGGGTSGGVGGDTLPIGSTVEWWSEEIPENWLVCNGQAVSRTEYADLFSVLGVTYGEGDGSTTFNLPNIQGRTLIGKSSEEDYSVLGKTGGEKQHSLTVQEMASHSHSGLTGIAKTSFMRAVEVPGGNVVSNHTVSNGSGAYKDVGSGSSDFPGANHYHDFVTNEVGEGKAFSIVQPYITTFYIIKAKQSVPITSTVEDVLNSTSTTNALSANQGRILNNKVVANDDLISTLQEDVIGIEDNMITNVKLNNATLPKTNKEVNIPIASRTQLGVFKVGENLTISEEGILSATGGGGSGGNEVEISEQSPTEGTVEIWVDLKEEYGFSPTIQSELYYSEEGLGTNIKLRDNPLDYDYLLIQYYTATDQPIINGCKLIPINVHADNSYNLNENYEDTDFSYIYNARITLTGIGIEFSSNKTIKISSGRQVIENTPIIIYKVIGFKK